MEKIKIKKFLTKEELIFLSKVATKPIPWSMMAEEVILHYNQEKLKKLINKFGEEFSFK